jgi:hypothetical protein
MQQRQLQPAFILICLFAVIAVARMLLAIYGKLRKPVE